MSHLTLMIIDCSDDFRLTLDNQLRSSYIIHHCRDGKEAQDAALQLNPDVIVLDLILTGIDGITLLHNLRRAGIRPKVLAVTRLYNDYVFSTAEEVGIEYLIRKPCDPIAVAERVRDLSKRLNPKPVNNIDPAECISMFLTKLSFSPRHHGYDYIKEAAILMWRTPGMSITKELYPSISAKFSVSYYQVERSIRTALNAAWEQSGGTGWENFSPVGIDGIIQRPSSGYLIAKLAEALRRTLESPSAPSTCASKGE